MWELICHHTYKLDGLPVDLSQYRSDGHARLTQFEPDGAAPGSGALRCAQPRSGIHIPMRQGSPWTTLGAIQVEVTFRLLAWTSPWQTLIAGDGTFQLFARDSRVVAAYPTPPGASTWTGWPMDDLGDDHDGIASWEGGAVIHSNEWYTVTFGHDGLSSMWLSGPGWAATRSGAPLAPIPGVGERGVTIGNSPVDGNRFLAGEVDEVKVWRSDPEDVRRRFLARPFDDVSLACWQRLFRGLREVLDAHPECAEALAVQARAVTEGLRRAILAGGGDAAERYRTFCEEYARLWSAGRVGTPEMATLFTDFCAWLRQQGVRLGQLPELQELLGSSCFRLVREQFQEVGAAGCDPEVAALVSLIGDGCSQEDG